MFNLIIHSYCTYYNVIAIRDHYYSFTVILYHKFSFIEFVSKLF